MTTKLHLSMVLLGLTLGQAMAGTLATAFTYQGQLSTGTSPAHGIYDLEFALYDALADGNAVGLPLTNTATPVSNGLFTVSLDFGSSVFEGDARWLQIAVRTNGPGAFVALSPRHLLTATPYAIYAPNSGLAMLASGVSTGAITSAMLADGAVTSNKISAAVLKALNLDDGGSAAYAELMSAGRGMQSAEALPFSELSLVVSNSGPAPSLTFRLNGVSFGKVLSFTGREGISEVYEYVVEVLSPSASLNPDEAIGQPGALTFARNGRSTVFAGIVTGCAQAAYNREALYTFRLEPTLAYLDLNSDYRLYQDMTAPDIVQGLYREITGVNAIDSLSGSHPTRPLTIQFAETDLNFFSRLLENEGAFYFFRNEAASTSLVLGDAASSYLAFPLGSVSYYGNYATNPPSVTEYVRRFQKATRESTKAATLNGYDFAGPRKSLVSNATAPVGRGEKYDYEARVTEKGEMDSLARVRLDRFVVERHLVSGAGNVPDLRPGYTFTLDDRSDSGLSGSYVVTSVRHSAFRRATNTVASFYYGNQFEALPTTIDYRPARRSPKPVAPPCTAVVTGKAGEEILTDNHGRVKVRFHWDRRGASDEHSSGWIRVATQLAGKGWGTFSVPRIGQEVLVEFVNGDPDQPVITGSFYNGENMPPYDLPANATKSGIKTRSSKGGTADNYNEIRFEDKKGSEQLYIKAEKDLDMDVNNDTTIAIGHDLTWSVANDLTLDVNNSLSISADSSLVLSSGQGVGINTASDPALALKVGGPVAATAFQGSGSGLSNLLSAALTGTISEVLLPNNIARLNEDTTFNRLVAARVFAGSGAGLTNLSATSLTGTISDARLSGNVARLNASQTFTGHNYFAGNVGIGTAAPEDARLDVEGNARLNDFDLFLRAGSDRNHGLGWYGSGKSFSDINVDGPVLYGCDGGGLGTACGSPNLALRWRNDGNVMIDPNSLNSGALLPGLTFGSFSGEGIASKRNAGGNQFGLDFYTFGTNRLSITQSGRVGLGTTNPLKVFDVVDGSDPGGMGGNIHVGGAAAGSDAKLIHFGDLQGSGLGWVYLGERGQDDTLELRASRFYFNAGNVGIGVTNPATPLEVVGTAKATRFEGDGSSLTGFSTVRSWQIVTNTTVTAVANRGYVANSASRIRFALPASANLGDVVRVTGLGAGGWLVPGTAAGDLSGEALNSVELLCVTNGNWRVLSHF